MESISLSVNDLQLHVISFGIDTYPQIDVAKNRTRLNMFYEEACEKFPDLFEKLQVSKSEFEVSAMFSADRDRTGKSPSTTVSTFVLTPRGPVLNIPVILPGVGTTRLLDNQAVDHFHKVRQLFFTAIPDTKLMRVGLVRRLVFGTGRASCESLISKRPEMGSAELVGGSTKIKHRDDKCNVNIRLEPVQLMMTTKLPIGQTVTQPGGFGLDVQLDVYNSETRPLEDTDINVILERAVSLWPGELLEFLNERSPS